MLRLMMMDLFPPERGRFVRLTNYSISQFEWFEQNLARRDWEEYCTCKCENP